jgi:hypothetical protein
METGKALGLSKIRSLLAFGRLLLCAARTLGLITGALAADTT